MRDRLIELIESARYWGSGTSVEIADYLLANGLIVPPCKLGDMVYEFELGNVEGYVVTKMKFEYTASGFDCVTVNATGKYGLRFNFDNIGKTVFLTREEAEQALQEGK